MKYNKSFFLILWMLFLCFPSFSQEEENENRDPDKVMRLMTTLINSEKETNTVVLKYFDDHWNDDYIIMFLEVYYFVKTYESRKLIIDLIERKTGERFGYDLDDWYEFIWNKDQKIAPFQGDWMARLYKRLDAKFERYFKGRTTQSLIRLDEVRWGGVLQDGIPPLRQPNMLKAKQANYLADDNVVFGISINGDHRAYPKRILAWHEMFVDEVGGEPIAGVYCTLCGTVIAYNTKFKGKNYNLGTSGFLYRSNKLMYDKETQSLWNTIEGKPVIGPLINSGIELKSHSVVTTTWGAWKKLHPDTQVLSLNTGYRRNYNEGNAYKEYFAKDALMFNVPALDKSLKNKDEVLIVRANGYKKDPLAISAKFLAKNEVYQDIIGDTNFVVLTDDSGGNRVYNSKGIKFEKLLDGKIKDANGIFWKITEEKLTSDKGEVLNRLPYHRIFWFAWYNTFKNTRLIK